MSPNRARLNSLTLFANAYIPAFTTLCCDDTAWIAKHISSKAYFVSSRVGAFTGFVSDAIICVDYTSIVGLV